MAPPALHRSIPLNPPRLFLFRHPQSAHVLLGELRERSQFVLEATSLQTNQCLTIELIHEREHLIPGELGKAEQEFFKQNALPLLNDCQ